jgi:hypothetical protein
MERARWRVGDRLEAMPSDGALILKRIRPCPLKPRHKRRAAPKLPEHLGRERYRPLDPDRRSVPLAALLFRLRIAFARSTRAIDELMVAVHGREQGEDRRRAGLARR